MGIYFLHDIYCREGLTFLVITAIPLFLMGLCLTDLLFLYTVSTAVSQDSLSALAVLCWKGGGKLSPQPTTTTYCCSCTKQLKLSSLPWRACLSMTGRKLYWILCDVLGTLIIISKVPKLLKWMPAKTFRLWWHSPIYLYTKMGLCLVAMHNWIFRSNPNVIRMSSVVWSFRWHSNYACHFLQAVLPYHKQSSIFQG